MDCTSCGRANRTGARFCGGCGASLAPRCPACGSETDAGARFCDACGAPLAGREAPAAEARKVVTIVFADLMGSTALHERLDAESARAFMERYYAAMRESVEAERGQVTQLLGDGVKAVFGAPRVAEDDALRAVRAAVAMQRAFRALAEAQRERVGAVGLRVAVHTGEVVAQDQSEIIGDPVNVAAHLQQQARDGDVLLGESTQRLVGQQLTLERVGTFALKGRAEPVTAWRVVSLERPAGAPAYAFVGRDEELRRILAVYETAVAGKSARLAVVLGSPGLGKSRLLAELGHRLGDGAAVLAARCDATGGETFAPLAEALRAHLCGEADAERESVRAAVQGALPRDLPEGERIADGVAALLAGEPASPEETFFVVRRLLAALAAERPVVLCIDDLHWAEPLLLDLTEHLVQWGEGVPLLVLAAARPELRDRRSSLCAPGALVSEVVTLGGLDAGAATRLAANAIGADELPAAIVGRVLAASEGNPLFVGELARMLVQDGALVREGDRWVAHASLAELEMPPTIQALLAARIERLRPEERAVLERAAVVGRHFSRAAVAELLPAELRGELDLRLEALRRSELIEPDTGWLLGEPVLRFHHVLIRDAAYRRLLKGTRAELHARFADWLVARAGDAPERDEMLGWHLEQAHALLCELGPLDARGHALGERAATHLAAAGRRALARDDLALAAGLLGRAFERLDAEAPARAELALDWCEALLAAGDVGQAARALDELGRWIGGSSRLRAWHVSFAAHLAALTDPQALRDTAEQVAAAATQLAAEGDTAGEAKAHAVHALVLARLGRIGASEGALDLALAAARRGGDRRRSNAVLAGAPLAALWGPSPVTRASGRCLDVVRVLRITQGAPAVEAVALRCQAVLEALRGRGDAARRMIASSRRLVEELGITQRLLEAELFAGRIELLEGDAIAAERCLRSAYDGLRDQGLGIDAAQSAALLGRALLAQDRDAEAEALSHESEALAGDDRIAGIAWRGLRAEALARRGEHAAAVDLARAAVESAAATDALLDHADARMALASALRAAGRAVEAQAESAQAVALWEAKGATLLVERARAGAGAPAAPREERVQPAAPRRRVTPNAAIANAMRVDAAVATRNFDAYLASLADGAEVVHHATGSTYTEEQAQRANELLFTAPDLIFEHEPLAGLGDSLALLRWRSAGAGEGEIPTLGDFGPTEGTFIVLAEVDAQGLRRRTEFFFTERLGDAIVRLYERYAELQPEGPARERAAAAARSVALMNGGTGGLDAERAARSFADDFEAVDHRRASFGSARGASAFLRVLTSASEVADDLAESCDDVLALRTDGLLLRRTLRGRLRAGGGTFEAPTWNLARLDAEGRFARAEFFEPEQGAEALARFDALTGAAQTTQPARRVRPNAASAFVARLDAAVAAKDAGALRALFAEDMQVAHHPTGTHFGRDGALSRFDALLRAQELRLSHEPIATLGESLVLCRAVTSVSALAEDDIAPAGAIHTVTNVVIAVDALGRERAVEIFAADRLADATACLYERYAERMPEGAERTRAAATARAVAALLGPFELARYAPALAPGIEFVDHRFVGMESVHGAEAYLRLLRALLEVADDIATRVDAILGLCSDTLLVKWTNSGTERAGGGAYERQFMRLFVFGADGLLTRGEFFDPEREAEALARFDALTAGPQRPPRRVRANAATANAARVDAAVAARDLDAFLAELAEGADAVNHSLGVEYAERDARRGYELMLASENLRFGHEPLATLGDSLALCRSMLSIGAAVAEVVPAGVSDMSGILLAEVDARGLRRHTEFFAEDHLGEAIARLYERHAERMLEGPERERASATARSVAVVIVQSDPDRYRAVLAPDVEYTDHRRLGFGSSRGAAAFLRGVRTFDETGSGRGTRIDDVFDLRDDALLAHVMHFGTERGGGGAYETHMLQICVFGSDGLLTRLEEFDDDRVAEALARLDALAYAPPQRFENVAARAQGVLERCWRECDWDGVIACFAPGFEMHDRRALVGLSLAGEDFVANLRLLSETSSSRFQTELIATRGEHLALFRARFSGELSGGAFEDEHLSLIERDDEGRAVALVLFDPPDREGAYAELDRRFAAGEGAAYPELLANLEALRRNGPASERDELARVMTEDFRFLSHRHLFYTRTPMGREQYIDSFRDLGALGVNTALRIDHLRVSDTALIADSLRSGTRDDGDFEQPVILVYSHDGRVFRSFDLYDANQLAAAQARYAELSAPIPAQPRIENGAARVSYQLRDAAEALDFERVFGLFAPGFRSIDRGRTAQVESDRDAYIEAAGRMMAEFPNSRFVVEHLATRGERLVLSRLHWFGSGKDVGPSEIEWLDIIEIDDDRRVVLQVSFEPGELDAAYAELDARYAASQDGAGDRRTSLTRAFTQAFAARDWDALAALLSPHLAVHDHRRLGWETLRGPQAYIQALRSLVELAPDVRLRVDHAEMSDPGYLYFTSWQGTREGGAFEEPSWIVCELDATGRILRFEQYGEDQLDAARARLAEIAAAPTHELLRIPPNAASRASDRFQVCADAGDWDALRSLFAPNSVWEDRRRLCQVHGDRELAIANTRLVREAGGRVLRTRLATSGDRLVLEHVRFARDEGSAWEIETLQLIEIDAEGRIVAAIAFDPDDRRAAFSELRERFLSSEAGRHVPPWLRELGRAVRDRDIARVGAALPDGYVFRDHRRTGLGRLAVDAYLASAAALLEQSPDASTEDLYYVATHEHGGLSVARIFGTLASGGEFESVFLRLQVFGGNGAPGTEFFELEDLEQARARLEALRPADPLRIPPNTASRVTDRLHAAREVQDWDALGALCAPTFVYDDRRRSILIRGDRDTFISSNRWLAGQDAQVACRLLATAGDRLSLEHQRWRGAVNAPDAEMEVLSLTQVDAEGRAAAVLVFDGDDRRAASLEMFERYARGEGARTLPRAAFDAYRAVNARDLDALRALLPASFIFHDHRRTGVGRLDAAGWLASLAQLLEQAPELTFETLYTMSSEPHGELAIARMFGTQVAGGEFEGIWVRLSHYEGERLAGLEVFELEELDGARARFEALRPAAQPDLLRIPPNAATRASERWDACVEARDWEGLTQLFAPDFGFEDRRRLLRDSGDREKMVMSVKIATLADARAERTLVATAGERIALEHMHFSVMRGASPVFEVETLQITEVCEDGHIVGLVSFDPDDRRAATVELRERFFRGEGAAITPPGAIEHFRAWHDQDLARMRATLPDGFWFHDHRRTGAGRIDGADAYIDSVTALFEQVSDVNATSLYHIALEAHGSLAIAHNFGTSLLSGGAVESAFVRLSFYRDGEYAALELFELEDLAQARARFEALRPAPAQPSAPPAKERVLPNAATRAMRRFEVCVSARDWQALTELHAPEFMYEDRRPLMRDSGNREKLVASVRLSAGAGARESHTLLATAGNRLALIHQHFSVVQRNVVVSELETLLLMEVDAEERFLHAITFDPASRAAAESELRARFEAAEPAQS